MLHRFRRLRVGVFPLFAGAMVALGIRLGWAHDPSCPHHAGQAAAVAAMPGQPATHSGHGAQRTDATHSAHSARSAHSAHSATATAAPHSGDSPAESPDAPCRCLDPDCCLTGVVAVLDADTGSVLAADASAFDAAQRPMPVSVARPGAYSTHRLPFPHAPPGFDRLT